MHELGHHLKKNKFPKEIANEKNPEYDQKELILEKKKNYNAKVHRCFSPMCAKKETKQQHSRKKCTFDVNSIIHSSSISSLCRS